MKEFYFDNAATTKVCSEAADTAYKIMTEIYGNPSSTHRIGRDATAVLKEARFNVSNALGCEPSELYFTSCGSEGDNWAVINGAEHMKHKGKHIITSSVEHDAVRKSVDKLESLGFEVTRLTPEKDGSISFESVINALRPDTILVSLMLVNNETGAITDIKEISKQLKKQKSNALLHTDAVQAYMKIPFKAKTLGADMITISGHKIHAPKGIGALYIKKGLRIKPYIIGGSQESGFRAGTESLPLIAAFGTASKIAVSNLSEYSSHMLNLKNRFLDILSSNIEDFKYVDTAAPHIVNVSFPGYRSEVILNYLDAKNIYVSKSSACKKGGRSHVLEAIGLDSRTIDGSIRVSFSRYNTDEEVDILCSTLIEAHNTLMHT